jgi:hypothetical protein
MSLNILQTNLDVAFFPAISSTKLYNHFMFLIGGCSCVHQMSLWTWYCYTCHILPWVHTKCSFVQDCEYDACLRGSNAAMPVDNFLVVTWRCKPKCRQVGLFVQAQGQWSDLWLEILTVKLRWLEFWVVTTWGLKCGYQGIRGTYRLHLQGEVILYFYVLRQQKGIRNAHV